jgi:hypothetical protein
MIIEGSCCHSAQTLDDHETGSRRRRGEIVLDFRVDNVDAEMPP